MFGEPAVKRSLVVYENMRNPTLMKYFYGLKTINKISGDSIEGASPPEIFIGSFGYPKVYIGPMVPPDFGDTSVLGVPERWVGKSMNEIVEMRSRLVRGMYRTNVRNVENGRFEDFVKELALADRHVDSSLSFSKRPELRLVFDDNSQPFGPSAKMKAMMIEENVHVNKEVESAHSDMSMGAREAMIELYEKGTLVSAIQKGLSAGLFGIGKNRKFVPTRWGITAVDDTLGRFLLSSIRSYDQIDSFAIYEYYALDNRWIVLMMPGAWSYELVEAWYPNTSWNRDSSDISIYSSYEFFDGRSKYAEIGGCYYAARLAVSELLKKEEKQASVVILREAHPGYIMPVGVWNVREHVREALKQQPKTFNTLKKALDYAETKLDISVPVWMKNSTLLRYNYSQRKLVVEGSKAMQ